MRTKELSARAAGCVCISRVCVCVCARAFLTEHMLSHSDFGKGEVGPRDKIQCYTIKMLGFSPHRKKSVWFELGLCGYVDILATAIKKDVFIFSKPALLPPPLLPLRVAVNNRKGNFADNKCCRTMKKIKWNRSVTRMVWLQQGRSYRVGIISPWASAPLLLGECILIISLHGQ